MQKSNNSTPATLAGIINLGKYTFVINFSSSTTLLPAMRITFEKNVHGNNPAYTKIGYGKPSEGTFASAPKKIENTIIFITGCTMAHDAPIAVCLYRTFTLRHARKYNKSRYAYSSAKFNAANPFLGLIINSFILSNKFQKFLMPFLQ